MFAQLSLSSRYNLLVSPDVGGSISLALKDTTLMEALAALRDLYGYDFKVQGRRITVFSNTVQTRLFRINYLPGRRQGASDIRVSSSSMTQAGHRQQQRLSHERRHGRQCRRGRGGLMTRPTCAPAPTPTSGAKCRTRSPPWWAPAPTARWC